MQTHPQSPEPPITAECSHATARPQQNILALDLGTTTGWAIRTAEDVILSSTVSFRPSRYDGGGMRYLRFRAWLEELAEDAGGLSAIWYEEVRRHVGTDASHVYAGFLAILTAWAEQNHIPYSGVPVGTWKRSVCGKSNATKEEVIEAMRAKGFNPSGTDEADALAILHWAISARGLA